MIQIKKVLFPTDFSECANHAQRYAIELAKRFEARLYLLNVMNARIYTDLEFFPDINSCMEDMTEQRAKSLESAILPKDRQTLDVETVLRKGIPFVEIIKFAKEAEVDLIVMGTHGRTGLEHILIGSVAERVVRKARCPVLTIPPTGHDFVMP